LQEDTNQALVGKNVTAASRAVDKEAPRVRSSPGELITAGHEPSIPEVLGFSHKTGMAVRTLQWGFKGGSFFGYDN
jgi:hypothetical protein